MKLSANVHYALIIVTDLALQGEEAIVTGNDIARLKICAGR